LKLAVIPARGGSKRIPRKNIKPFAGLPMIAWSIRAAIQSQCFDRIIVSTDDHEIAEVARAYGAEVPFMRPAELSDDHTSTIPVIAHAIDWMDTHEVCQVTTVCCIYATAPFVIATDIRKGLNTLNSEGCDYVFSVTSFASPIQRAFRMTRNNRIEMFYPELFNKRSQDLEVAWHDAAQFYWGRASAWLRGTPLFSHVSVPIILPRYRVQDIDTEQDWVRAEYMFNAMHHTDNT